MNRVALPHLDKIACAVMQLLDDSRISAGDLNSCFITLNLANFFKLLNMASYLQPASAQQVVGCILQEQLAWSFVRVPRHATLSAHTL